MDHEQLRKDLESLQQELRRGESFDEHARERLQALAADIEELLSQEDTGPQDYKGLGARLKEAVAELEASHPRTTLLMRQVIDSLSYLGI